jgi:hypothetical protein
MRAPRLLRLAALATGVAAFGCSEELAPPEPARPTIGAERFGAALADLVVARIEIMPDTAAYGERLEEILRRHDVSREEMRAFVEVHGQNDDLVTGAYARVSARLDSLYPAGGAVIGGDTLMGAPTESNAEMDSPEP